MTYSRPRPVSSPSPPPWSLSTAQSPRVGQNTGDRERSSGRNGAGTAHKRGRSQRRRSCARSAREAFGWRPRLWRRPCGRVRHRNDVPAIRLGMESDLRATTAIFAVFPIVVVAVLILSGDISDNRTSSDNPDGLTSSLLGTALSPSTQRGSGSFVGRAFHWPRCRSVRGIRDAAMVEFSAVGQETRAGSITTRGAGDWIALATIVGGALIQYAPYPTHLNFWVLFAVLAILFVLPGSSADRFHKGARTLAAKAPDDSWGIRMIFAASAIAATSGYVIGG